MSENVRLVIQLCQKLINCGRNVTLVTNHRCHKTGMGAKKLPSSWHFGFADIFTKKCLIEFTDMTFSWPTKTDKNIFAHMEPQFICVLTCVASLIHDFANDHFTSSERSVCYYTSGLWCSKMTESSESKQNAVWIRACLYLRHRQVSICILPRFSVNIW